MARLAARPRWAVTAAALVIGAMAMAGCGSHSAPGVATRSGATTTSAPVAGKTASSGGAPPNKIQAIHGYLACMRSRGVTIPPPPRHVDPHSSRFIAANSACQHLLPHARPVTAQEEQDYLRAAACMRAHGITNFPDPTFTGGQAQFPIPAAVDTHSRQFTQARQICQRDIPAGLPYSGG